MFMEFIQRGRADTLQFAARQRRLEHVRRIHRALSGSCSDNGVQFVDHQDDVALASAGLLP
jgi:hypothetical protein